MKKAKSTKAPTAKKTKKVDQVKAAIARMSAPFSAAELEAACPGVNLSYVRMLLNQLRRNGEVRCLGRGPNAKWKRV